MEKVDVIKDLLGIMSTKVKKLERGVKKTVVEDPNREIILKIIHDINNDPYVIADLNIRDLMTYFSKYLVSSGKVDIDVLSTYLDKEYTVTVAVARGYAKGIPIRFDDNDKKIIKKLQEYLILCVEVIEKSIEEGIQRYNTAKDDYSIYYGLYDKLRSGVELEFVSEEEISIIEELIKDKSFTFYCDVMKYIHQYNRKVQNNKAMQIEQLLALEEIDDKKKKYAIDDDLLKYIFEEYGYSLDGIPKDIYRAILENCDANKIIDILDYISTNLHYGFLKEFGKKSITIIDEKGKRIVFPKNDYLIRRQFLVLYHILRYSNNIILKYLDEDCASKDLSLEEIITKVKGVVRHVSKRVSINSDGESKGHDEKENELAVAGVFEYFKANSEELIKLSKEHGINYLNYALNCEKYIYALGTDSNRFKNNIELLSKYGYKFGLYNEARSAERLPWMMALALDTNVLLNRLDVLIENGIRNGNRDESFAHFLLYPSVVYYGNKLMDAIVLSSYNNELHYLENGKLQELRKKTHDVSDDFFKESIDRPSLNNLRNDIPEKYRNIASSALEIDYNYTDEYLERIEEYIIGEGSKLKGLAYDINGVVVSLPKLKRIWKAIKSNYENDYDLDTLFVFALTYGSYYVDSELDELNSIINGRKMN